MQIKGNGVCPRLSYNRHSTWDIPPCLPVACCGLDVSPGTTRQLTGASFAGRSSANTICPCGSLDYHRHAKGAVLSLHTFGPDQAGLDSVNKGDSSIVTLILRAFQGQLWIVRHFLPQEICRLQTLEKDMQKSKRKERKNNDNLQWTSPIPAFLLNAKSHASVHDGN